MTAKEKAFCEEYVINGYNATQAYLKVYEASYDNAQSNSYKVLQRPHVKVYIELLQKAQFDTAYITPERVALKLAEIAFAPKGDKYYNSTAQLKALDLLQKQLGVQTQKIDANVSTDINIEIGE